MNTQKEQTALITGASSGIGLELAKLCAHDGYNLVLVARDREALERQKNELSQKYSIAVAILDLDLTRAESAQKITDYLALEKICPDVLINNAGFGDYGFFKDTDWIKEEKMIRLNIVALTHLTKIFAKKMIEAGRGKILNVASIAAFQPGPLMAVYYATKAYVLSFSEALANELKGTGVTLTILCPGPTATGFQNAAAMGDSNLFSDKNLPTAAEVARAGYTGLKKGQTIIVPGFKNKAMILLVRLAPRALVASIVRKIQE